MSTKFNTLRCLALIPILMCSCSTPRPVLQLAGQGAAMTTQVESEMEQFIARRNWAYEQRLMALKRLAVSDIESRAQFAFENFTADRAGMRDQTDMMKLIRDLADYRAKTREDSLKAQAEIETQLHAGTPTTIAKDKFTALQKSFAHLSEELSTEEWLTFTINYGQEVQRTVKKLNDEAKAAEKKAKDEAAKGTSK